jgi:hypothetical protein
MDQTIINATDEFLKSQIAIKDARIQELEEHIQRVTQRDYTNAGTLQGLRDMMHEWTVNALEQNEISQSNAEEIAEICDFELTKEVEVNVTVDYYFTLQVPAGQEAEDIINDVDFEAITYDMDTVTHVSAVVASIDI